MSRRLKAIGTLVRLQDRALQAESPALAEMQTRMSVIEASRSELARMRREECAVTEPAAMPYVARFLSTVHREDRRLGSAAQVLSGQIETRRGAVLEAYRELKSTQSLDARIRSAATALADRAEQDEADERSIIRHARARAAGQSSG